MLGHLTERELEWYNDILKCRALGRELNEAEQLAARLQEHDWSFRESDSPGTVKAGHKSEEDLIADIDASGIADDLKLEWLKLFDKPYGEVQEALKPWAWVRSMRFLSDEPERGKVRMALAGVTDIQYSAFLILQAKFKTMSDIVVKAGCTQRLIMTDDTINFTLIRERAAEEAKKDRELFFYGVTLPQKAQDIMDDIVRNDKELFISMVDTGAAKSMFPNFQVDTNNPGGTWLVTMQCTGDYNDAFGFFFTKHMNRPRREWAPRLQGDKPTGFGKDRGGNNSTASSQFIEEGIDLRRESKAGIVERRNPANANIPAIPERRVKTPMALSNRPMAPVVEKPKPKKVKTAPKARAKKFEVLGNATQLGELLTSRSN